MSDGTSNKKNSCSNGVSSRAPQDSSVTRQGTNNVTCQPVQTVQTGDSTVDPGPSNNVLALLFNQLIQNQQNANMMWGNSPTAAPVAQALAFLNPNNLNNQVAPFALAGNVSAGQNQAANLAPVPAQLNLGVNLSGDQSRQFQHAGIHQQRGATDSRQNEMKSQLEKAKELLASDQVPSQNPSVTQSSVPNAARSDNKGSDPVAIVPCRARGMPIDHNFKTAYFVIPEKVKHGEQLVCSYPACRNGGVKFRFCSACRIPVAKRNFRNRHNHDLDSVLEANDDDNDRGAYVPTSLKTVPTNNDGKSSKNQPAAAARAIETPKSREKLPSSKKPVLKPSFSRAATKVSRSEASLQAAGQTGRAEKGCEPTEPNHLQTKKAVDVDRRLAWTELLANRPLSENGDEMSAWLMQVLAVSDSAKPLKSSEDTALVDSNTSASSSTTDGSGLTGSMRSDASSANETLSSSDDSSQNESPSDAADSDLARSSNVDTSPKERDGFSKKGETRNPETLKKRSAGNLTQEGERDEKKEKRSSGFLP